MPAPRRLRAKVTNRKPQLSHFVERFPHVSEGDSLDGLQAPARRRSSVHITGDIPPEPNSATWIPAQQAPRSKKPNRLLAGNLSTRPASIVQLASDETRLTLAQLVEFGRWGKSMRDHTLDARRPTYDETVRSEIEGGRPDRREDPGASEVRGGQGSRPPRDQTLPPANQGATG